MFRLNSTGEYMFACSGRPIIIQTKQIADLHLCQHSPGRLKHVLSRGTISIQVKNMIETKIHWSHACHLCLRDTRNHPMTLRVLYHVIFCHSEFYFIITVSVFSPLPHGSPLPQSTAEFSVFSTLLAFTNNCIN